MTESDAVARWLVAYDDALASGVGPAPTADEPPATPELSEDLDLLHQLNRLRPRQRAAETDPEAPGPHEGRYVLCGLRAVGGVGEIWLAHDEDLERDVALKVLRPDRAADPAFEARFLHEARITARLQHPGIVPVYDLVPRWATSPDEGPQPAFYTMRLVPGRTLAEAARAFHVRRSAGTVGPLELNALLTAFVSVCQTVAYAHSRGVIHRDLKPQNVALGEFGEVIVLDWGLAREVREASPVPSAQGGDSTRGADVSGPARRPSPLATHCGDVLGTPAYMAPEQAAGQPGRIDRRTDVHGLGAILYEILTGRPPFSGSDTGEVVEQARQADPPPPRLVWPGAPAALESVCLKALAHEPEQRYDSASEVALEVQHWLADEPVAAYREPAQARLQRWGRRHRPLVAGGTALLLTAVLAGGLALILVRQEQTRTAETRAQAAIAQAEATARAERDLRRQLYFHRIALAERTLAANNPSRAFQLLTECPIEYRAWEWHCLKRVCHGGVRTLSDHEGTVSKVVFSPDGRRVASASFDGTARIWDAATGRCLRTLRGHDGVVSGLAYSPDGRLLATAGWDCTARVWDVQTGRQVHELRGHTALITRVVFRPDGLRLATLSNDNTVRLWDPQTGQSIRTLATHVQGQWPVTNLAYSPDGRRFALAGPDEFIRLWDAETGREVGRLEGHRNVTRVVAFSSDGRYLASGDGETGRGDAGEVRVWDAVTGEGLQVFHGHTDPVFDVAFSPNDDRRLVSAGADQTVKLWALITGQEALTLHAHTDVVRCVSFSPDGLHLATAGADQVIKLWDATPWSEDGPAREQLTLRGPTNRLFGVAVQPDGRRLAAVGDNTIRVWEDEAEVATHPLPKADFFTVAFRPGTQELVTAGSDGVVLLLDSKGEVVRSFSGHLGGPIKGLAITPDGRRLVSASWDRTVRVWDVDGDRVRVLRGHQEPVLGVAVSPDGKRIASASADRTVKVWNAQTGEEERTLSGHGGAVLAVSFSPRGDLLASAGNDGTIRTWEVARWRELPAWHGHTAAVRGLAFSPDGKLLASGGDDWTVRLWRLATGEEVATLRGHTGRVSGVAFSANGTALVSASFDGTVKEWAVP